MNSIKIEMGAILALKNIVQLNDFMKDYINENDKEPSWDGHIYLYKSDDLKVENIKYRIPVQVKGKNDNSLLKKSGISFPVEYKHLRNYCQDGGVFYIVVVISDDKRETTVFYTALTTVKLKVLLKKSEKKQPEQTKNIALKSLTKNDDSQLYKALAQFGYDREHQGSGNGEIIKKAININTISKVDTIQVKSYITSNEIEALKKISTGELCLYGHRTDIDMWLPFDYEQQQKIKLKRILQVNKEIRIDDKIYYDKYWIEEMNIDSKILIIRVSENLVINMYNKELYLEMYGNFDTLNKDAVFLGALLEGKTLWLGDRQASTYPNKKFTVELYQKMDMIINFTNALKEIKFICDKMAKDFDDKDWNAVMKLISIYKRRFKIKEERNNEWCIWWWDGKLIPLLVVRDEDNEIQIVNWLVEEGYVIFTERISKEQYILSKGIMFHRDIWENLYDIEENILLEDIKRSDFCEKTMDDLNLFFVEIMSAYDKTKNEKYYKMSKLLITKLLKVKRTDEISLINYYQLIKRKRDFSEKEIFELEQIEDKTDNKLIICAVNILLENKNLAKRLIEQLPEEQQRIFKDFPIYNLL